MTDLAERYLTDAEGHRTAVVVPIEAWQQILDDLEELSDIRAYDAAKQSPSDPVPLEQALAEIAQGKLG